MKRQSIVFALYSVFLKADQQDLKSWATPTSTGDGVAET